MTWNSADKSANITLSGSDLIATASSSTDGAIRGTQARSSGKYYFEITPGSTYSGGDTGIGICTLGSTLSSIGANALNGFLIYPSGASYFNGSFQGNYTGSISSAAVIGFAVDLVNSRIWARNGSGNWMVDPTANPATNTNGFNISTLFPTNAAYPVQSFNSSGSFVTANFTGPFVNAAPSGFSPWEGAAGGTMAVVYQVGMNLILDQG